MDNKYIIPDHELEIKTSRSSGAGGQHVNTTDTKVTIRWNIEGSHHISTEEKALLLKNLSHKITADGYIVVHNESSRSQMHNKKMAIMQLGQLIKKNLHVPKKRVATRISTSTKEKRLQKKARHSIIKKMRSSKTYSDE